MFAPGRLAYCIELDDELADSDIPTTLIRSKADVPLLENSATLTTNDIVINKLAQILSYLRHGRHGKKGKKVKVSLFWNSCKKLFKLFFRTREETGIEIETENTIGINRLKKAFTVTSAITSLSW